MPVARDFHARTRLRGGGDGRTHKRYAQTECARHIDGDLQLIRPGAGTMLASELTAKALPDGYTLLMVTNSHTINAGIHKNLSYSISNSLVI